MKDRGLRTQRLLQLGGLHRRAFNAAMARYTAAEAAVRLNRRADRAAECRAKAAMRAAVRHADSLLALADCAAALGLMDKRAFLAEFERMREGQPVRKVYGGHER